MQEHESTTDFEQALTRIFQLAVKRNRGHAELSPQVKKRDLQQGLRTLLALESRFRNGIGLTNAIDALLDVLVPALSVGQAGPRYFGFVTGGTLPSALLADLVVSLLDNHVTVHLPMESLSTVIEHHALVLVLKTLGLSGKRWTGTFTTGATTSNILALAAARQATIREVVNRKNKATSGSNQNVFWDVAEDGLGGFDLPRVRIYACEAHSSVVKSAAILGIGRRNVIDVGNRVDMFAEEMDRDSADKELLEKAKCLEFDLAELTRVLKRSYEEQEAAIVVVGLGEVVTGALTDQIASIRALCSKYNAWLHVDAAFAAFVCMNEGFKWISSHLDMCDSIAADAHKTLNVPYDCGIFLIKKSGDLEATKQGNNKFVSHPSLTGSHRLSVLDDVCGPSAASVGASYLSTASLTGVGAAGSSHPSQMADLPSPMDRNLENSRRFRALPVYISLLSQGYENTKKMVERQLEFASRVREWLREQHAYQVMTPRPLVGIAEQEARSPWAHKYWASTIVCFRADPNRCPVERFRHPNDGSRQLVAALKEHGSIYVSGGKYCGADVVRLAVSNWATGLGNDEDFEQTTRALADVMRSG